MRWIAGIAFALVLLLVLVSFLPLIEVDAWWVRYWDFPRVQIAFLLVVLLAIHLIASERDGERVVAAVLALAALLYHGIKLVPFTPVAPPLALIAAECREGADLRILSFNAQRSNEAAGPFLALVEAADPDLILVMETDAYWDEALARLAEEYPNAVQHIPEDARYFGMHLLSRRPLLDPEVRFLFDTETPSIVTGVELALGEAVEFHGIHPRPPVWLEHGTTRRDATIYRAALDAAKSARPTVVAGDFNAVPWETTMRQAVQIGGLLEPRIGRALIPTYGAESALASWPLDYVLHQDSFALLGYRRLPHAGSDHHPVLSHLCLAPELADRQRVPRPGPEAFEDAQEALAAAEALRGE